MNFSDGCLVSYASEDHSGGPILTLDLGISDVSFLLPSDGVPMFKLTHDDGEQCHLPTHTQMFIISWLILKMKWDCGLPGFQTQKKRSWEPQNLCMPKLHLCLTFSSENEKKIHQMLSNFKVTFFFLSCLVFFRFCRTSFRKRISSLSICWAKEVSDQYGEGMCTAHRRPSRSCTTKT